MRSLPRLLTEAADTYGDVLAATGGRLVTTGGDCLAVVVPLPDTDGWVEVVGEDGPLPRDRSRLGALAVVAHHGDDAPEHGTHVATLPVERGEPMSLAVAGALVVLVARAEGVARG